MKGVLPLMRKEFLHIRRDPRSLVLALCVPLFLLILFGYAITLDIRHIPLVVWDQDGSRVSRELVAMFLHSGRFQLRPAALTARELDRALLTGEARALLTIPPDFSARLQAGKGTSLQVVLDGADSNTAVITLGYMNAILAAFSDQTLRDTGGKLVPALLLAPPFVTQPRIWFNPELRSVYFVVPGIIGVIMMVVAVGLSAMAIVQERERGTLEGLLASPLRPLALIVGKLLPYGLIALLDVVFVLLAGISLFQLPLRGDLLTLVVPVCLFLLAALGIGLFIPTLVESQQAAWMLSLLFTLLPAIILSGFIFPLESMPRAIQTLSLGFPVRYFLVVLRGVILKGAGFTDLLPQIAALALCAVVSLAVSAWRFQRTMG